MLDDDDDSEEEQERQQRQRQQQQQQQQQRHRMRDALDAAALETVSVTFDLFVLLWGRVEALAEVCGPPSSCRAGVEPSGRRVEWASSRVESPLGV